MYCTEHCTYDLIRWNTGKCTPNGESSAPTLYEQHVCACFNAKNKPEICSVYIMLVIIIYC